MAVLRDTFDAATAQEPHEVPSVASPIVRVAVESWRFEPRLLSGPWVSLREVRVADAPMLWYHVKSANLDGAMGGMPASVPDFERFIEWAREEREAGRLLSLCAVDRDARTPAGLFQAWPRSSDGLTAEWGFGIGCAYWGTGFFEQAAVLLIDDLFDSRRVERLEAVTGGRNPRGAAALRRLGARPSRTNPPADHTVWVLTADDWRQRRGRSWPGARVPQAAEGGRE